MKRWSIALIYPALFFYALFVGVKNNFTPVNPPERFPASIDANSSCFKMLANFYDADRNKILKERLENTANDIHMFYRSFPPLFYKLAEDCNWRNKFSSISSFISVMAGDAHMENFGLKFYNKQLRLSVNDYDDLTFGPPFLDVLRLLVSAKLAKADIDKKLLDDVLQSYKRGLKGKDFDFSKATKKLMSLSKDKDRIDSELIDINTKLFKKKKSPNSPLSKTELERWQKTLSEYGNISDSYLFVKQNGGSAGLKRYQFLMEKDGELSWIEAKEWVAPSYNIASGTPDPADLKRYNAIVKYDKPFVTPKLTVFDTKTFYLRNIDARQMGVTISDLKKDELKDVLIDEAYALGDFHRTFLPNEKDYSKVLENDVHKSDLQDFIDQMSEDFKAELKSVQK
jgi:hypothetical protein